MQDMSPDMEDLMRKASEAYPLKQTDDRWEEIASNINAHAPSQEVKKASRYKRYFASILLLLLFFFLAFFLFNKTGVDKFGKSGAIETGSSNHDMVPAQIDNVEKTKPLLTYKSKPPVQQKTEKNNLQARSENKLSTIKQKAINDKTIHEKKISGNEKINNNSSLKFNRNELIITSNNIDELVTASKKQNGQINILALPFNHPIFSLQPKTFSFVPDKSVLSPEKKKGGFYKKGFYYGVVAGKGLNSIKNQEFKKAGGNVGLVGGYYFSKKFSIETGLIFSQKYYSTMGNHFSLKEIGPAMPAAMKIIAVDGYSKMIEIPVVIRYDFFQKSKQSFFTSAGFSSYLLTNENNQYHTLMNSTEQMMYGNYKNNNRYFAASLDLGIGFSQNFGNKNNIRFQPYLQIPLQGVGVGDLQILGAGFRVVLTRQAH